jgi:arylsulfatase A-like enzyme
MTAQSDRLRSPRLRGLALCVLTGLVSMLATAPGAAQAISARVVHVGKRPVPGVRPNVLLLIADDLGVDNVGAYAEHPEPARTPVIDQLAAQGLLFRNAWSNQTCSPSRSTLLTGRYTFRTGVGRALTYATTDFELGLDEDTLPQALLGGGYRTAAVGKWHLAAQGISGPQHPLLLGFEHHRGPMDNLPGPNGGSDYWDYAKAVDGVITQSTTYATTDQVDDALALIASFGSAPWFLWLAFSAPHSPYHAPPAALHTYDLPTEVTGNVPVHMKAMAEAMDTEIGRLLASIPPGVLADTIVIFLADNGTTGVSTTPPFDPDHAKASLYEGGVNVPLIVAGPGVVAGEECAALVNLTDVVATVAELAGVASPSAEDAVSLVPYFSDPDRSPVRTWVYSQRFAPVGFLSVYTADRRTARNVRFKLLVNFDASAQPTASELFDLSADPFETTDLLQGALTPFQQAAHDQLVLKMQGLQSW